MINTCRASTSTSNTIGTRATSSMLAVPDPAEPPTSSWLFHNSVVDVDRDLLGDTIAHQQRGANLDPDRCAATCHGDVRLHAGRQDLPSGGIRIRSDRRGTRSSVGGHS